MRKRAPVGQAKARRFRTDGERKRGNGRRWVRRAEWKARWSDCAVRMMARCPVIVAHVTIHQRANRRRGGGWVGSGEEGHDDDELYSPGPGSTKSSN